MSPSLTAILGALLFAGIAAAVLVIIIGLRPAPAHDRERMLPSARRSALRLRRNRAADDHIGDLADIAMVRRVSPRAWRHGVAVVVGLLVLLLTRWPVAGVLAYLAVVFLPSVFGGAKLAARQMERLQALGDWTRRLSTLLSVGSGLEDALAVSRRTAPAPVAREVSLLVTRLQARQDPAVALGRFADDIDDPVGDQIAAALTLAMARRGRGLASMLEQLADTVSEQVESRRRIEADRATPRATARNVTITMLLLLTVVITFDGRYLRPYSSVDGQLVLVVVGAVYAGSFAWMKALSGLRKPGRFLAPDPRRARASGPEAPAEPYPIPAPAVRPSTPMPDWGTAATPGMASGMAAGMASGMTRGIVP